MQKVSEEVLRWEEGKKWQHKVENLKMKLAEKTKELEKAEKSLRLCRDALNRGDRTKASSQNKLKRYIHFLSNSGTHLHSHFGWLIVSSLNDRV